MSITLSRCGKASLDSSIGWVSEAAGNFRSGITSKRNFKETLNSASFHYQVSYNEISLKHHAELYIKV